VIRRCKYCGLYFVPETGQPDDDFCSDLCRGLCQARADEKK